jgi:hypothetical protein
VSIEKLKKLVPPQYIKLLPERNDKEELYNAIVFLKNNSEVVLSRDVKKALKKIEDTANKKIAFGYNFTFEAKHVLTENRFEIILIKDFPYWNDADYIDIHSNH